MLAEIALGAVSSRRPGPFLEPPGARHYVAVEFNLRTGEYTGTAWHFTADNFHEAVAHLAYTLNLKSAGWRIGPSGKTVSRSRGDISWAMMTETKARERGLAGDPLYRIMMKSPGQWLVNERTDISPEGYDRWRTLVVGKTRAHAEALLVRLRGEAALVDAKSQRARGARQRYT